MTADSLQMPPWSEVQKRIDEDTQQRILGARLRRFGIVLMAVGGGGALLLLTAWLADPTFEHLRRALNPFCVALLISGVVLLVAGIMHCALVTRIARLERRAGARAERHRPSRVEENDEPEFDDEAADPARRAVVDIEDMRMLKRIDAKLRERRSRPDDEG